MRMFRQKRIWLDTKLPAVCFFHTDSVEHLARISTFHKKIISEMLKQGWKRVNAECECGIRGDRIESNDYGCFVVRVGEREYDLNSEKDEKLRIGTAAKTYGIPAGVRALTKHIAKDIKANAKRDLASIGASE